MGICPLTPDTNCPYCGIVLIGKIVTREVKNPENYIEGLIIITIYICLRCQTSKRLYPIKIEYICPSPKLDNLRYIVKITNFNYFHVLEKTCKGKQ